MKNTNSDKDPFDLERFIDAQSTVFDRALSEVQTGKKQTHWMWYIFPQMNGLGFSSTSRHYGIKCEEEARAYLQHPVLGKRLIICAEAALAVKGRTATQIFGSPDDAKLKSSATLFASISDRGSVFARILDKYFEGKQDEKTLKLLKQSNDT